MIAKLKEAEALIEEKNARYKKLEEQQASVKKVDEFNLLTQQMSKIEREKNAIENNTSNILNKKSDEEDLLEKIQMTVEKSKTSSKQLEADIQTSINEINREGLELRSQCDQSVKSVDPDILKAYMRLLKNKQDRVVVPIVDGACSGCWIKLTLQQENLVRKSSNNIHNCEHCSRILYCSEENFATAKKATKRRRRRSKV